MEIEGLVCSNCGNTHARKLYYGRVRNGCDRCYQMDGPVRSALLHTYNNEYHSGLSMAKEKVFDRSYIDRGSGMVLDRDTGREAAY